MWPGPWSSRSSPAAASSTLLYPDEMPLLEKIRTIAREIYRAKDIAVDSKIRDQLA